MAKQLEKLYNPKEVEDRTYQFWMNGGYFTAKPDPEKKPYTIVIPPPNITGQLHMGHALDETLQDILIRYKRMQGYAALWIPGTDHASIATEAKIVEAMRKEGLSKADLGREKFLERAWAWKEQYGGRIVAVSYTHLDVYKRQAWERSFPFGWLGEYRGRATALSSCLRQPPFCLLPRCCSFGG